MFAFHLSRVAVRFFHSLLQIVYEDRPLDHRFQSLSKAAEPLLHDLLKCLLDDSQALPFPLRPWPDRFVIDREDAKYALLSQTAALRLAFLAFRVRHVRASCNSTEY